MNYSNLAESILGIFLVIFGIYKGMVLVLNKPVFIKNYKCKHLCHSFFSRMEQALLYKAPYLHLENQIHKTNILRIYARVKFSVFLENIEKIVIDFEKDKKKGLTEHEVLKCFDETIKTYREKAIIEIGKEYTSKIGEIFDNKFTVHIHCPIIKLTRQGISDVFKSSFYGSDDDRLSAILNILLFAFEYTLIDIEKTCSALNGELSAELKKQGIEEVEDSFSKKYITREEAEMSERVQNVMIKEIKKKIK